MEALTHTELLERANHVAETLTRKLRAFNKRHEADAEPILGESAFKAMALESAKFLLARNYVIQAPIAEVTRESPVAESRHR